MKHLDLFSGIGGFALAARWVGWETVGFCEIDPYCQKVLRRHWPDVPIHEDIRDYDGQECNILTAGFPCQPYSRAGKQRGERDDRDLWPEVVRISQKVRPPWIVAENVTGFIALGLKKAITDLAGIGYECLPVVLPACARNAPHRRDRLFLIAHAKWDQQSREKPCGRKAGRVGRQFEPISWDRTWEDAVAHARGVDDGLSGGLAAAGIAATGNTIVPQIAEMIGRGILAMEAA